MDEYTILKIEKTNSKKFRNIRLNAVQTNPEAFGDTYDLLVQKSDQFWINKISTSTIYVVETNEVYVGMIAFKKDSDGVWSIKSLWVDPAHRDKGLAKRLVEKILNTAQEQKIPIIELGVNATLRNAITLYESFGFEIIKNITGELMGDGSINDLYVMRLTLLKSF